PTCAAELLDVEHRVVRLWMAVHDQQSKEQPEGREQNAELEGRRNERRPAIERSAADVDRQRNDVDEVLHPVPEGGAEHAAEESNQRDRFRVEAERVAQTLYGKRRVGVHRPVSRGIRAARRPKELTGGVEF